MQDCTAKNPWEGIKLVTLELIRDQDAVEIHDGDEFVTLHMEIDPFEDPS